MPIYRSGDTVTVKEGYLRGQNLKVVEVKGSVLLLEDAEGVTTELFIKQGQRQMLFGETGGGGRACVFPRTEGATRKFSKKVPSGLTTGLFIRVLLVV